MDNALAHIDYHLTDLGAAGPDYYLALGLAVPANTPDPDDGPSRTPAYTASATVGYHLDPAERRRVLRTARRLLAR